MKKGENIKINNGGFTLVELLIAMIILAVISIPILNSFVSSYKTSARSVTKQRATNIAEVMFEEMKSQTLETTAEMYGMRLVKGEGDTGPDKSAYHVLLDMDSITDNITNPDVRDMVEKGYTVDITLDPTKYTEQNGKNVGSFNAFSKQTSAIMNMSDTLESRAFNHYRDLNQKMASPMTEEDLRTALDRHLKREIRADIEKLRDDVDDNNRPVEICTVTFSVNYYLDRTGIVEAGKESFTLQHRMAFDNSTSRLALSSVAIMYVPRFDAAGSKGDIITVHNHDGVKTNLYVVAQVNRESPEFREYTSKGIGGAIIRIFEKTIENEVGEKIQPISLFTNLNNGEVADKKTEDKDASVAAYLSVQGVEADPSSYNGTAESVKLDSIRYRKYTNSTIYWGDTDAGRKYSKALRASDIDGRSLDRDTIEDRLYDVYIVVDKDTAGWPEKVEFEGTVLRK